MIGRVRRHWFLLALTGVLILGAVAHEPLGFVVGAPRGLIVAGVMLAMSASIDLGASLRRPGARVATIVGLVINTLLAPPLAWALSTRISPELGVGLVIVALAPCTLASAAVWTRRGGGNEAVALAITVITNVACVLTAPAWAGALLRSDAAVAGWPLVVRLAAIVLAPLIVGQLVRRSPPVRRAIDRVRGRLSVAAQLGLLSLVLIGSVRCGRLLAEAGAAPPMGALLALLVAAVVLHLLLWATAWKASRTLGAERPEALAAAIGGSQKTLAVGLDLAIGLTATAAPVAAALAILPMIVYHAAQLLLDAALVERAPFRSP